MKLSIGPILYYWPRQTVLDFYDGLARAPVDIVYLGEVVCAKRHELRHEDWLAIGENLEAAGKEVVLSAQALLESESDLRALRRLIDNGKFRVEANDMSAVALLAEAGREFVAGPHVNAYNGATLKLLRQFGARRWVLPLELPRATLEALQAERPGGMQTEVFAYGRMPLAFSARCFTARAHNLDKDSCEFRCVDYPDGLPVRTREDGEFLVLNGIQTQSTRVYSLINEVAALLAARVDVIRISPQHRHTLEIARLFRDRIDGKEAGRSAAQELEQWMPAAACNGYWHGRPGMEYLAASPETV